MLQADFRWIPSEFAPAKQRNDFGGGPAEQRKEELPLSI